jgi:hypothetical protein
MNIEQAMEYAQHADFKKETIAHMCRWQGLYCVFVLTYEMITDEEPEDNGPRFSIEYIGGHLNSTSWGEEEIYTGKDLEELTDDIIECIHPDRLAFQVYNTVLDTDVVPYIYEMLLPNLLPKYDSVTDTEFYGYLVDRALHLVNKNVVSELRLA